MRHHLLILAFLVGCGKASVKLEPPAALQGETEVIQSRTYRTTMVFSGLTHYEAWTFTDDGKAEVYQMLWVYPGPTLEWFKMRGTYSMDGANLTVDMKAEEASALIANNCGAPLAATVPYSFTPPGTYTLPSSAGMSDYVLDTITPLPFPDMSANPNVCVI